MNEGAWYYSPDHGQLCQVIESQTLSALEAKFGVSPYELYFGLLCKP